MRAKYVTDKSTIHVLHFRTNFTPTPPKPTFDLCLTYFNIFGVSGLLGGLLLLEAPPLKVFKL